MLKPLCSSENVAVEISQIKNKFKKKNELPKQKSTQFLCFGVRWWKSPCVHRQKKSTAFLPEAQVLSSTTAEALAYQL